jgi:hypothetical protein
MVHDVSAFNVQLSCSRHSSSVVPLLLTEIVEHNPDRHCFMQYNLSDQYVEHIFLYAAVTLLILLLLWPPAM